MEKTLINNTASELFNYGTLGIFCVFLIICLVLIWKRMDKKDTQHSLRIDQFTEVMRLNAVNEAAQTDIMKDLKTLMNQLLLNSKN